MNAREALLHAIEIGFDHIEIDISVTSDFQFVAGHDYWAIHHMPMREFLDRPVRGFWPLITGHAISLDDIIKVMREHPFIKVMFDCHFSFREIVRAKNERDYNSKGLSYIDSFTRKFESTDIRQRAIYEVYSIEHANALINGGCSNAMLWIDTGDCRIREFEDINQYVLALSHLPIRRVSVPARLLNQQIVSDFHALGIQVYSPGWRSNRDWHRARAIGVDFVTVDTPFPNSFFEEAAIRIDVFARHFYQRARRAFCASQICKHGRS